MSNSLAIKNTEDLKYISKAMAASGYFSDTRKQSQAIAKIMFGQELNIGPAASMSNIHIIKGKPSIGSHLIAAKVKQSDKYNYKIAEKSEKKCVIDWYEEDEKVGQSEFTIQQAKQIGLTRKDNWKNYPKNMLFARAISNGAKMFCPDVFITGVYTPEEMQSVEDADYEVVEDTEEPTEDIQQEESEETPKSEAEAKEFDPDDARAKLDELAEKVGVDSEVIDATIEAYASGELSKHTATDIYLYLQEIGEGAEIELDENNALKLTKL